MRRYKVAAENVFVFMHTNTFNNDPFYFNDASARFAETTNDTGEVIALAVRLGERLWRDTLRILGAGPKEAAWKLRSEHRSPRWTTRWDELQTARAR